MCALLFFAYLVSMVGSPALRLPNLAVIISPGPYVGDERTRLDPGADLRAFSSLCADHGIPVRVIGAPLVDGPVSVTVDSNLLYAQLRELETDLQTTLSAIRRERLIVYYSGHGLFGALLLNEVGPFWRRIAGHRSLVAAIRRLGFRKNLFMFDCCFSGSFKRTGASFVASSKWYQFSWEGVVPYGGFLGDFSSWIWRRRDILRRHSQSALATMFEQETNQRAEQVSRYRDCIRIDHPRIGWLICVKAMHRQTPVFRMAGDEWTIFKNFWQISSNRRQVGTSSRSTRQLARGVEQVKGSSPRGDLLQSKDDDQIAKFLDSVEIKESHVDALKKVLRQMDEGHLAKLPGRSFGVLTVMIMIDIVQGVPEGGLPAKYDQMIGEVYKLGKPLKSSNVQRPRGRHHRCSCRDML